jgi:hypothetical protein
MPAVRKKSRRLTDEIGSIRSADAAQSGQERESRVMAEPPK